MEAPPKSNGERDILLIGGHPAGRHLGVQGARSSIVTAVTETRSFAGVTGEHSFDEFGDTSNRAWTVYKAESKEWKDIFSGEFQT